MAEGIERGEVRLLTRTSLNWTEKYDRIPEALAQVAGVHGLSQRGTLRHGGRRHDLIQQKATETATDTLVAIWRAVILPNNVSASANT